MKRACSFLSLLLAAISVAAGGVQRPFIADAFTSALWHLNEASVGMVYDATGNGNTGTEQGTSVVAGYFGNGRRFNGTTSYISFPDQLYGTLDFSATQSFTVEAWFRTTSSETQTIVRKGLAPVPGYLLQMIGGKVVGNVGSYDENIRAVQSTDRYDDGLWHHTALVVDRKLKMISLYVDGGLAATPVQDSAPFSVANDRPLTIGRWENESWPSYFTGDIDEVRISRVVRYAPTDTVACWRMDEVEGSLVADSSPWHLNGTASGTTIVPGIEGNARQFDGSSSVGIPDPGNGILGFSATESFTVEVSFKTTYASDQSMIRRGLAPVPGYLIQMLSGKVVGNVGSYDTTILHLYSTKSYNDGQWHTAVMVTDRDQAKLFLYVDGELATDPVDDPAPFAVHNDRPFTLGRWENYDWPYFFHGALDNVIVLRGAHHPSASTDPRLQVVPQSLSFGVTQVGSPAARSLTIRNLSSEQQLDVTLHTTDAHFTVSRELLLVPAGTSDTVTVWYAPTAAQRDTGSLVLSTNDPLQPEKFVPLSGTGGIMPPWTFVNTGATHTIIIPTTANTGVEGMPLTEGDYVGVFFDSAGTLKCGGFEEWMGGGNIAVAAFGDDPTSVSIKDGFAIGEVFRWKIFRALSGEVKDVEVTYSSPSGIVTHTNTYATNGISRLESFTEANVSHCLNLRAGWSLISSTVVPYVTTLDTIFKPIVDKLVILKNGKQKSYIPAVPVNTIGLWNCTEGYQIKMSSEGTFCLLGRTIDPAIDQVVLPAGWSIMPYLRDSSMSIAALLGGISSYVVIVKDQDGKTYIPSAGINTIGDVSAGQGYLIKMTAPRTLTFPASAGVMTIDGISDLQSSSGRNATGSEAPAWQYTNTGESHTVIVPVSASPSIKGTALVAGDYIGVFYDSSGTLACAGYERWTGTTNIAVAAFGDDATTPAKDGFGPGEVMRWRIWRASDGTAFDGTAGYLKPGSLGGIVSDTNAYSANAISALASLSGNLTDVSVDGKPGSFSLEQNYPNPFNPSTSIAFRVGGSMSMRVRLCVYDMLGQEVAILVDDVKEPGYYAVHFDAARLASGVYMYRLTAGDFTAVKRLVLLR